MIELLHGGPTGHSASVLMALHEKGLPFRSRAVDLARFEQHSDAFLAENPAGQVPVLFHDGRKLTDSGFILEYLEETFPDPPLMAREPGPRYFTRTWSKHVEERLAPAVGVVGWCERRLPELTQDELSAALARVEKLTPERRALWRKALGGGFLPEVEAARAAMGKVLAEAEAALGRSDWLDGAGYSIGDIAFFPHAAAALDLVDGENFPRLRQWLRRISEREAVRAALPEGLRPVYVLGPEKIRWG